MSSTRRSLLVPSPACDPLAGEGPAVTINVEKNTLIGFKMRDELRNPQAPTETNNAPA